VLAPLNPIHYQIKKHCMATVGKDGYIRLREDVHYYSVPSIFIGKKLRISYTASDVEIFDGYQLVASHPRNRTLYRHTTNAEHLSARHKAMLDWSPESFLKEAARIHEDVEEYIRKVLELNHYVDKSNKICSGILSLAHKVGASRLAAACRLAAGYGSYSFLEVEGILKTQSELTEVTEEIADMPEHENIRGKEYYE